MPTGRFGFLLISGSAAHLSMGVAAYAFSQWVLLAYTGRSYGVESLGVVALALALTGTAQSLFNFALRYVYAVEHNPVTKRLHYLIIRLFGVLLLSALSAVVAFLYSPGDTTWYAVMLGVTMLRVAESIADICAGFSIRDGPVKLAIASYFLRATGVLCAVIVSNFMDLELLQTVLLAGSLCVVAAIMYDLRHTLAGISFKGALSHSGWFQGAGGIFRRALPLALAHALVLLQPAVPRYLLEFFHGPGLLGVFAALMTFLAVGNLPVIAANQLMLPKLAATLASRDWPVFRQQLSGLLVYSLCIGAAGIGGAIVLGDQLLVLVFGQDLSGYGSLMVWTMVAGALAYVTAVFGNAMTATGSFSALAPVYGAVSMLALALGVWLIPRYDVLGAIVTFGAASSATGIVALLLLLSWKSSNG